MMMEKPKPSSNDEKKDESKSKPVDAVTDLERRLAELQAVNLTASAPTPAPSIAMGAPVSNAQAATGPKGGKNALLVGTEERSM